MKTIISRIRHVPPFVLHLLVLAALFWIVRYWHSSLFGLYEDDLSIIPRAAQQRAWDIILPAGGRLALSFADQGRPFHHLFIKLLSNVGWQFAQLRGAYLVGYVMTVLNIVLFYSLMRRTANHWFALIAGLGYVLYSADTSQAYLTLSLGVQPSLTLVFLALHCYLSNKRILGYVVASMVLFSYETPFLLFIVAPLLKREWDRKLIRELLVHGLIVGSILVANYLLRVVTGMGLRPGLTLPAMMIGAIKHILGGPVYSLGSFIGRPLETIQNLDEEVILATGLSFIFLLWILSRIPRSPCLEWAALLSLIKSKTGYRFWPEEAKPIVRMMILGAAMLITSYPLALTLSVRNLVGRATRVHMPGVAGSAIILAAVAMFLIYLTNTGKMRILFNALLSLEVALLVGYGFVLQRDYVAAWKSQQMFWTELLPLIPDAGPGTIVLVDYEAFQDIPQIGANTWVLPRILEQLYAFPPGTGNPPSVYRLVPGWEEYILGDDGQFQVNADTVTSPPDRHGDFPTTQTILIESTSGHLSRHHGPLILGDQAYPLKALSAPILPDLSRDLLYDVMILP